MPFTNISIKIRNVRSFLGGYKISLKPLTLVVGENSSGKTTFLAMCSLLTRYTNREQSDLQFFDNPPYDFGGFDSIISSSERGKQSKSTFSIGFTRDSGDRSEYYDTELCFGRLLGQTRLKSLSTKSANDSVTIDITGKRVRGEAILADFGNISKLKIPFSYSLPEGLERDLQVIQGLLFGFLLQDFRKQFVKYNNGYLEGQEDAALDRLIKLVYTHNLLPESFSIAPIRSRPERIYGNIAEDFQPEGTNVPRVLARILLAKGKQSIAQRASIEKAIRIFGSDSGLFSELEIQAKGRNITDPFAILVKDSSSSINIIDVGYGVSQVLPLIVQSVLSKKERLMLIQQPEIHLHPKAQAALGSFFVSLAATGEKSFVIESHSDYLLDRVRLEVANGLIGPDDIQILFFDKRNLKTHVSIIELDDNGNLKSSPRNYRKFFLQEEMNLFTRAQ